MPKDTYRATNHKDEYPQMTTWTERHEKVEQHVAFIKWWQQAGQKGSQLSRLIGPPIPMPHSVKMARNPSTKAASFDDLTWKYGAIDFQDVLVDFIAQINRPGASAAARKTLAADTLIPFRSVPVFHKIKFTSKGTSEVIDAVHVWPEHKDAHRCLVPPQFDAVVICSPSQGRAHIIDSECPLRSMA